MLGGNMSYITITSISSERLGSQMNNYAMLFLMAQKTGHSIGIYKNYFNNCPNSRLISSVFDTPLTIIDDNIQNEAVALQWDTTWNINALPPTGMFELDNNLNYNINAGIIHFNYLYFLNAQKLEYLKRQVFCFKGCIERDSQSYFNCFKKQNKKVVSVHVRRTDHCTLSPEYQKEAIQLFSPEEYSVIVLSDDINFCKHEFSNCLQNYDVIFSENISGVDMHLMTLCDANIIADSTFSFWGAMLNDPGREMILPRSILPSAMNLEKVLSPVKNFRSLSW